VDVSALMHLLGLIHQVIHHSMSNAALSCSHTCSSEKNNRAAGIQRMPHAPLFASSRVYVATLPPQALDLYARPLSLDSLLNLDNLSKSYWRCLADVLLSPMQECPSWPYELFVSL
jgi:hypothetical protein